MKTRIFFNANIETLDTINPKAQAMLVENGIIKIIGTNQEVLQHKNNNIESIDLKGKFVMPGFNDSHIHIWKVGDLKTFMADLRGVKSIDEMLQKLLDFSNKNPNLEWIMARGFNETLLKEKRIPTKYDLDKVFLNKPVYLIRTCAHIAVVNSKALEIANINKNSIVPFGGQMLLDNNNNINGIFTETAKGLFTPFLPKYTKESYIKMIEEASKELLSLGITSATDPAVMPDLLEVYKNLEKENKLKLRINAIPIVIPDGEDITLPLPTIYKSDFLNINTVKFFSDGGLSGQTAATYKPYKNSNNCGVLRLNFEKFYPIALNARKNGWRIATHAIGDKAIDEVIKVYEKIQNDIQNNIYNRIEHLGIVNNNQLKKIKELNISIVTQPIFLKELGNNFLETLSNEYIKICYPFKSMFDNNLKIAFSTDAPVVKSINPFEGIKAAIDRKTNNNTIINKEEVIDLSTSLKAYTIGSAIAQQEEENKGTLSKNKFADFIILNENILQINLQDITKIKVLNTYISGNLVY